MEININSSRSKDPLLLIMKAMFNHKTAITAPGQGNQRPCLRGGRLADSKEAANCAAMAEPRCRLSYCIAPGRVTAPLSLGAAGDKVCQAEA